MIDGDYLIVDQAIEPYSGAVAVAVVEGELTVKRLHRQRGVIELQPENKAYPPIRIKQDMELLIWGVVSGVFRKTTV